MSKRYVLVPPKGVKLDLESVEQKLVITQDIPIKKMGPRLCHVSGRIYNTIDPVESAVAEGECLSRIHHPLTPRWVKRTSQLIFGPFIVLTVVQLVITLFTMSRPGSFIELIFILLVFVFTFIVLWVYWVVFVSGPKNKRCQSQFKSID